jgi:hypothetical protein
MFFLGQALFFDWPRYSGFYPPTGTFQGLPEHSRKAGQGQIAVGRLAAALLRCNPKNPFFVDAG